MPFDIGLFFVCAHNNGVNNRLLFKQTRPAIALLDPGVLGSDWAVGEERLATALRLYNAAGAQVPIVGGLTSALFPLTKVGAGATGDVIELELDLAVFEALTAARKNAVLTTFINSGSARLDVQVTATLPETLEVQLRALKTTNFLLDADVGAPANANIAERAHHDGVAAAADNLTVPAADALANYAYHVSTSFEADFTVTPGAAYEAALTVSDPEGHLTFPAAGSAPPDSASRNLLLRIYRADLDKYSLLPIDVHVPTDMILLFDRSGSMGTINSATSQSKWAAAEAVGNLFSRLYGDMVQRLTAPSGPLASRNMISIARFWWDGAAAQEVVPAFVDATTDPMPQVTAGAPNGGTPIGESLASAAAHFVATYAAPEDARLKWRRRHVLILTDGMDNRGAPSLSAITTAEFPDPSDVTNGIYFHNVSYALTGETPVTALASLNASHLGSYYDSAPDSDPLNANGLREMYLDVLANILPVERATGSATEIPVEDGVERCIFVATLPFADPADKLELSLGAVTTDNLNADQSPDLSWVVVDSPPAGVWTVDNAPPGAQVFALYDLALRMRCGADAQGVGEPIRLWAEITQNGLPVTGADVRVGSSVPAESLGELLTTFVQKGGLFKALRYRLASRELVSGDLLAALAAGAGRLPKQYIDTKSIQRQLLDVVERARNLKFQYSGNSFTLTEVRPGCYEATIVAASTQNENVYNFYFRADGVTRAGAAFARDRRISVALPPVPGAAQSGVSLTQTAVVAGTVSYVATVFPKTATNKPVGPGLAYSYLVFDYVDPKDRAKLPPLMTRDNLDGTYSTTFQVKQSEKLPAIALFPGHPPKGQPGRGGVPVTQPSGDVRRVKVTLDRVQVLDDKDGCLRGDGELAFSAVVAPNGNPSRAVRTRIPGDGTFKMSSGQARDIGVVIYEGLVESDACLAITLGGTEFDYMLFFTRQEKLARYHRTLPVRSARMQPGDEQNDPESLSDWLVWYTVQVE